MVDGQSSCEYLQFFELVIPVVLSIFDVDLSEEGGIFLYFGDFFLDSFLPIDFLDLFGFEVALIF